MEPDWEISPYFFSHQEMSGPSRQEVLQVIRIICDALS